MKYGTSESFSVGWSWDLRHGNCRGHRPRYLCSFWLLCCCCSWNLPCRAAAAVLEVKRGDFRGLKSHWPGPGCLAGQEHWSGHGGISPGACGACFAPHAYFVEITRKVLFQAHSWQGQQEPQAEHVLRSSKSGAHGANGRSYLILFRSMKSSISLTSM
jgi:hypothetical protein